MLIRNPNAIKKQQKSHSIIDYPRIEINSLSICCFVHNLNKTGRGTLRVRNFLYSLRSQVNGGIFPKIIIFDWSNDDSFEEIDRYCREFESIHIYKNFNDGERWNKSMAINRGIKMFPSDYIMGTDIDYVFAPNFLETVKDRAKSSSILLCHVHNSPNFEILSNYDVSQYKDVLEKSILYDRSWADGACQIVSYDWFQGHRGYDEEMYMWGGMDNEFSRLAILTGLNKHWLDNETSIIHQFHQEFKSENNSVYKEFGVYSRKVNKKIYKRKRVRRNRAGWGDLKVNKINDYSKQDSLTVNDNIKWILQGKSYGIGNFIMLTPAIQKMFKRTGQKVNVFFETPEISTLFNVCDYINCLTYRPETPPIFKLCAPKREKGEGDIEAFCRILLNDKTQIPKPRIGEIPRKEYVKMEPNKKYIAIIHGCAGKYWLTKKDIGVNIRQLLIDEVLKNGAVPVIIGTDSDYNNFWKMNNLKGAVIFLGKLSLLDSVGLLSQCDTFISNDTGLYHAAAAIEKNGMVIWNKTDKQKNMQKFTGIRHLNLQKMSKLDFKKGIKDLINSENRV